jgi:hypothetical protein
MTSMTAMWSTKDPFADYENQLQSLQKFDQIASKYGKSFSNPTGNLSSSGTGNSQSSNTSNSSSSNTLGINGIGDITNTAKDLARFRLDLDKDMGGFSSGLRDKEFNNNLTRQKDLEGFQAGLGETRAQSDFGRTTKFTDQTYGWQQRLNQDTQNAMTGRLEKELTNRRDIQSSDQNFQNFNTQRAVNLASRRLGS